MRIFWDYKRSFIGKSWINIGLPFIFETVKKVVVPAGAVFSVYYGLQLPFYSNTYYDEYDGDIGEIEQQ